MLEAPVQSFPKGSVRKITRLVSRNFGASVKDDETFQKEMKAVEQSYEKVLKLNRGFHFFYICDICNYEMIDNVLMKLLR